MRPGPRLLVLGWFGFRNLGDERLAAALTHAFPRALFTFVPARPWPLEFVHRFDGVVLTGGIWHPRSELVSGFRRWCSGVRVPFFPLGLGVDELPPEQRAASRELVARSPFLWVRDARSAEILDSDRVSIGPDLTFLAPLPPTADRPRRIRLNLRPWRRDPWEPGRWLHAAEQLEHPLAPWPFAPGDAKLLGTVLEPWPLQLADLGDTLAVVGMRLHSLIFAVQLGVPAIGIAYDSKCRRFLETLGGSDRTLELDGWDRLEDLVAEAASRWDDARATTLEIRQRLVEQAQELGAEAREAIDAHARPAPLRWSTRLRHRLGTLGSRRRSRTS